MNEMMDMFEMLAQDPEFMEMITLVGAVALIAVLFSALVSLVLYIFRSAGVHSIAKRRGIPHAWLAWIPIAHYWTVGSIADQYRQKVYNKPAWNRVIMLVLAIVLEVVSCVVLGIVFAGVAEAFAGAMDGDVESLVYALTMAGGSGGMLDSVRSLLNLALVVFWHISLYNLYSSCCPKNNVTFLVLGIIFPVAVPFFLFFNRKKDDGMVIPSQEGEIPPMNYPMEYL